MLLADKAHYPSLALCKELKKINIPRTEKYWFKFQGLPHFIEMYEHTASGGSFTRYDYFCPSIMEMLDWMPETIGMEYRLYIKKCGIDCSFNEKLSYMVMYKTYDNKEKKVFEANTLPDAMAQMVLWLHQNKYISFTK